MLFLKKFILGFGALFLIFVGGAGTQSQSMLLQGGGLIGLIIGLVILYIFAKMAWRAMGCLPSIIVTLVIVAFILYAIGGFNGGVSNLGHNLKGFIGLSKDSISGQVTQAGASNSGAVVSLLDEEDIDKGISENLSSPAPIAEEKAPVQQAPQQQDSESFLSRLIGGEKPVQRPAFNPQNFPAIYSTASVVSGDTLIIGGNYFRLFGVDAPEMNQSCADRNGRAYRCGQQAAAWLNSWLQDNQLECRVMQQDKKGNKIGTCSLGAYDIGAALVNAGWAVAYTKHTDIYVPYQQQAQSNGYGLWQGEFYMPWDWHKIQSRKPDIKIIKQKTKRRRTILNPLG